MLVYYYIPAGKTGQRFFQEEPEPNATIWRYMDIYKYLAFVMEQKLTFVSLSRMQDKWEGAPNKSNLDSYLEAFRTGERTGIPMAWLTNQDGSTCKNETEVREKYEFDRHRRRELFHANCWHRSEYESEAMWKLYGLESKGIAVRTTWGALLESLKLRSNAHYWVWGGNIVYGDPRELEVPLWEMSLDPVAYKRPAFAHEREVRLLISAAGPSQPTSETCLDCSERYGECVCRGGLVDPVIHLDVDLETLVKEIRVHPDIEDWQLDTIRRVTELAGVSGEVVRSDLNQPPTPF